MIKILPILSFVALFLLSTPKPPRETISPLAPSPTLQTPGERISEIFADKELTPESTLWKSDLYEKFTEQSLAFTASEKNKLQVLALMSDFHSQEQLKIDANLSLIKKTYTIQNYASKPHSNLAKLYTPTFSDFDHKNYASPYLSLTLTPSKSQPKINQNIFPTHTTKTAQLSYTPITKNAFVLTWLQEAPNDPNKL